MNHRCKICGNIDGNIIYNVKERILNKGDVFAYLHCAHCGTLMLNEPIEDKEEATGKGNWDTAS